MPDAEPEPLVVDASTIVETLLSTDIGSAASAVMRDRQLHAPAHLDAEVLSALGRLHRAGELDARTVETRLRDLALAPIARHPLAGLLAGAWSAREQLRLVDALYVELTRSLGCRLLTADARLARATQLADVVAPR